MTLQLEGNVDNRDELIESLRADVQRLQQELATARAETKRAGAKNGEAILALRNVLTPLYRGLQAVFGEIEAADIPEDYGAPAAGAPPANTRTAQVWNEWKSKLGGTAAKVIEALLIHGELNTQQLAIATGLHRTTVPNGVHALNKAGLINKNNGKFSLKQL